MDTERTMRHPNGGALKIGLEVHVSADSFCDDRTQLSGMTSVFNSAVRGSNIQSSHIFECPISFSTAIGSVCSQSVLKDVFLEGAIVDRVFAEGKGWRGIYLKEVVAENCELYGNWELSGNARIHEGVWHRAPRFRRITGDNGVDFGLSECKPGHAMLGCWCKPLTELLRAGPRLGRKHGWSEEQIRAAKEFYEMLGDVRMEGVEANV